MIKSVASFHDFSLLCQQLEQTRSRNALAAYLGVFFQTHDLASMVVSVYLLQGLFQPAFRPLPLGISDALALDALARLRNLPLEEIKKLFHVHGDLGIVAELTAPSGTTNNLNLVYVHADLKSLSEIKGGGAQEQKKQLLVALAGQMSSLEQKFFFKLVVNKLRLGVSDATVLKGLAKAYELSKNEEKVLERVYALRSDLGDLAATLDVSGIEGVGALGHPQLHTPIQPAAAERMDDAVHILEKLGIPCIAQPKYDGLRIQIHIDAVEKKITMFSRNMLPMEAMFPELHEPLCNLCAANAIQTMILDGELIGFDETTQRYKAFQDTAKINRKHVGEKQNQVIRCIFFDCLFKDGVSLLDAACQQRLSLLQSYEYPSPYLLCTPALLVHTDCELTDYFEHHVKEDYEGIMIKRADSPYRAGERTNAWVKWKRIQSTHGSDTIDAVIVGYYFGQGKRTERGIGAFLAAVYNKERECFQTIAKVGTGLDEEQWKYIKNLCDAEKIHEKPLFLMCKKSLYPDVWCNPHIVVSLQADEITKSSEHTANSDETGTGMALRFPRLVGLRTDKDAQQTTLVEELRVIFKTEQ